MPLAEGCLEVIARVVLEVVGEYVPGFVGRWTLWILTLGRCHPEIDSPAALITGFITIVLLIFAVTRYVYGWEAAVQP